MHFDKHLSLAIGISSAGSGIGGVILPIAFTQLLTKVSFGWATRVLAFVFLCISVAPLAAMRYPRSFVAISATQATAQRVDAADAERSRRLRSVKSMFYILIDQVALREWPYLLMNLGLLAGYMGLYIVLYYVGLFALGQTSVPAKLSSDILIILNASSTVGRIALSALADTVGPAHVPSFTALISAVLVFCLLVVADGSALVGWPVVFGLVAGGFMGLPAAGVVSVSSVKTRIGTRLGMTLGIVGCGVLVAEPIAGAILDNEGGWTGLIGWCAALLIASALSIGAARLSKTGAKLKALV
ncbi:MAG: hypothetical protein Q9165_007998 [Trypethelium subeluteriae]